MNALVPAQRVALAGVLFAEDFDDVSGVTVIEAPPEPEVIAPVFTLADMESVRQQAHDKGRAAARAEADAAHAKDVRAALAAIAAGIDAAAGEQAAMAQREAEEVAGLLLDTLMTLLPALCERHAEAELRAVARVVLPALKREPAITVRVSPHLAAAMRDEIERLDPDLLARVCLIPTGAMAPGDVRVNWADGTAVRDTRAVWGEIADVLERAGLRVRPDTQEADANDG